MLTKRQNIVEVITGGKPDRYGNQYEFLHLMLMNDPFSQSGPEPGGPGREWHTQWGVTYRWDASWPGGMPIHIPEDKIVLHDINDWKSVLKAPNIQFPEEAWTNYVAEANAVDRNDQWLALFIAPGLFEITHHLMGMENALMTIASEPDKVKEMINWYADWEISYAQTLIDHIHPDALFHHDDWGSQISTFISPAMFQDIYLPVYKRLYGWYKKNGIELLIHHSDSYAATFVPFMIEMGVDIWQGVMSPNNVDELVKRYGGQISFMGGIDNGIVDRVDWTPELIDREVRKAIKDGGKLYYIPDTTMGDPSSSYPGVYEAVTEKIKEVSKEDFPETVWPD